MSGSLFKKYDKIKANDFKDNQSLNSLLEELSSRLKSVQKEVEKEKRELRFPTTFVIGCPRSGTTLLMQWLASLGIFAYPTNLLARFAYAPYIGALVQEMLFNEKFDYNGDFNDIHSRINFDSNLGKSKGALAVNEFQHFFRNYTPNFDPEYLDGEAIKKVDFQGLRKGIASIESVFQKPFVTKAMMFQFNLKELIQAMPNSIFLYIKRNPIYNMQSIYLARIKYYNSEDIWWSVKPKQYNELKELDVYHQIAGQVYYTNQVIENQLSLISSNKQIEIRYDDFCKNPSETYALLKSCYEQYGIKLPNLYQGKSSFDSQNKSILENKIKNKLEQAYQNFVDDKLL